MRIPERKVGPDGLLFPRQVITDSAHALAQVFGQDGLTSLMLRWDIGVGGPGFALGRRADNLARLAIDEPETTTSTGRRLDYELVLQAAQLFDQGSGHRQRVQASHTKLLHDLGKLGFRFDEGEIFQPPLPLATPGGTFNTGGFNEVTFGGKSPEPARAELTGYPPSAVVTNSGWAQEAPQLLERITGIETALRSVAETLRSLREQELGDGERAPGMGHNRPPVDQLLSSSVVLDDAVLAVDAIKEETKRAESNTKTLALVERVLRNLWEFAKWAGGLGKSFFEEMAKSAGQKAGERLIDGVLLYGCIHTLAAQLPAIIDSLGRLIHH